MNNKLYSITLADGTVVENLRLNGTNYISETPVDKAIFEDNCSPTIISDGEFSETHDNMELIHILEHKGEWWLALRDISEVELEVRRQVASLDYICSTISDEDAPKHAALFPTWRSDKTYSVGDRVRCGKKLFKCLTAHTSQSSWIPTAAPSLWARADDPTVEWPEWVQPTGATDAYAVGSKVSHNDKHWVSDTDNNTWEPGVYGWTEQTE